MSQYIFPISVVADGAQKVLDIQAGRTPRIPRSPLSPRAPWPTQEPAATPAKAKRTDAENLLRRAEYSAYYRQPAPYLRLLLDVLDTPRPTYRRMALEALASGEADAIAAATESVQGEITRRRQELGKMADAFPVHYPRAA